MNWAERFLVFFLLTGLIVGVELLFQPSNWKLCILAFFLGLGISKLDRGLRRRRERAK
jgi:hypothetical protein